jgi:hypothetical protein
MFPDDLNLSARGMHSPGNELHNGCLSRTVRTEDHPVLPRIHIPGQTVNDIPAATAHRNVT